MLRREDNERLTRVGPGTPMGKLMRRYWQPALLSWELAEKDGAPLRVRLLGEDPPALDPATHRGIRPHDRVIPADAEWREAFGDALTATW